MKANWLELTCEVELGEGEQLSLPDSLTRPVGPGRWLITVQPAGQPASGSTFRDHNAFLNGYAPQDEGLYDDAPTR